jgi:hypothetical protein
MERSIMIESIRLMKNSICNGFRRRFTALSLLTLALTGLSSGCAPFATFPPDSDTGLKIYPWMAPAPEVMATSIRQTHARVSPDTPLIYNLPAGMTQTTWQYVQNKLGPDARAMVEGDKVFLDLKRFGVRNTKAFADIAVWNDDAGFLVTVSLKRNNVMPFRVTNLQRFYISMSEPMANYPVSRADEPVPSDDDADTVDQAGGSK